MTTHNTTHEISLNNLSLAPEPIAIVGIGCRFPGGSSGPQAFWDNLLAGKDCIVDVPKNRWDVNRFYDADKEKPGKMYVKSGGFLHEAIDEFDALFFGISPREAAALDPQQRVLLEVSWEALEDAGIDPDSLSGSSTGVFVGGFMLDNKLTQLNPLNRHTIASNTAVGMTLTMLSNRISYLYDLRGPSMSIDTACSSSMVALDQACRSIWTGDSSLALVGGVNIMHRPEIFIAMCKGGFLAPDGRSKAFDERGDGYGRGEGAGIVVLKLLRDAERDGDHIYSVIRATGCNQDGHTDGITVPNPTAQQALIRKVSDKAGVALKDIAYFEAHGTGTAVGDPIEMSAIGGTVGQARAADETCLVGSVKGNIGHLEAASGIAAVIKSALCLQHELVPPQANLINLNPKIPFAKLQLRVPRQIEKLQPVNGQPLYAGINSFGYGGTNACALLQNYIPPLNADASPADITAQKTYLLPLSAKSKNALKALAVSYRDLLKQDPSISINDLVYSAGARRAHLSHRVTFRATSELELIERLDQFANGIADDSILEAQVSEARNRLAFVFTGMGPQWWAMGRELMASEPVFMASVKRSDAIFQKIAGWSILEEMQKDEAQSHITETQIAQPANFVVQAALLDLWRSWGVTPAAVVGHSVGEVTTAYASGILSLEQALLVSYHRSRIQKKAANQGSMLAVGLTEAEALAAIAPYNGSVSIAAINAPTAITLAGDENALAEISEALTAKEIFNRLLQVEVAYHSPTMDPLLDEIRSSLAQLSPATAQLPTYSTVTGEQVKTTAFDAEYWCKNVREPVYFFRALEQMIADGYEDFVEIGPHPVLSSSIKECFAKHQLKGFLATSLKRKADEQNTIKRALAEIYGRGYAIDWAEVASKQFVQSESFGVNSIRPQFVRLPNYPWQRERYWNDADTSLQDRIGQEIPQAALGVKQEGPDDAWISQVNSQFFAHLADHKVEDLVILAGATYVEAGLSAHKALTGSDACLISDLSLHNAMVIDADAEPLMFTRVDQANNSFAIHSYKVQDKNQTTLHATGKIQPLNLVNYKKLALDAIKKRCDQQVNATAIYRELDVRGLQYGPYFQGIQHLWRQDAEILALIQAHNELQVPADNYQLHPTLLDACFQSLISALPADGEFSQQVYVPVDIRQLRHYQKVGKQFYCHGILSHISGEAITGDITLCDEQGNILVEIRGLRCQTLRATNRRTIDNFADWTYQPQWQLIDDLQEDHGAGEKNAYVMFLNEDAASTDLLRTFVDKHNGNVSVVYSGNRFEVLGDNAYSLDPNNKAHLAQLFKDHIDHHFAGSINIIYGWAMSNNALDPIHLSATQTLLEVTRQVEQLSKLSKTRLYVLTRDAARVVVDDKVKGFQQSPVIGLGRVIATELPAVQCTLIDLGANFSHTTALQVFRECTQHTPELEIALRNGERYAYRLRNVPLADAYQPDYIVPTATTGLSLATQGYGEKRNQELQVSDRVAPAAGEIALEILSLALDAHSTTNDWREVCARVAAVGSAQSRYKVGDELIACYHGAIANWIVVAEKQLIALPKPTQWRSEKAAPALSAFSLACAGLLEFARLGAAESLLVIGAETAVGQAAVQLAQLHKADCLQVTVDSDEFALNSASLTEDLLAAIYRKGHVDGFDVIINLAGDNSNLQLDKLLADGGQYIAIQQDDKLVAPVAFSASKTQLVLNRQKTLTQSARLQTLLTHVETELARIDGDGLFVRQYSAAEITTALASREAIPAVVSFTDLRNLQVINRNSASYEINDQASYLITGGFGGFGLGMAKWLVQHGAKHLVLVSRSGANTHEARSAVAELISSGAHVKAAAVDIADAAAVHQLLAEVEQQMPPLKGIFHAAGVLDDRELLALDDQSLATVMRPKALGAWNLHQQTHHLSLDCFVLYSSISALIGNRNQGNYVAANLFLDSLAQYRQAQGLPACSINWGALADVGMAANNPSVIGHLAQVGINAFSQAQALEAFSSLLQAPVAQLGIFQVDWARWKQFEPAGASVRFSDLAGADETGEQGASWQELAAQGTAAILQPLTHSLAELVATTLKMSVEQLDVDTPINRFGLDSLMAMDLQMKVRGEFKVDVSILELMKGNSVAKLAEGVVQKLVSAQPAVVVASAETIAPVVAVNNDATHLDQQVSALVEQLNHLDQLSEEELDALLKQEEVFK